MQSVSDETSGISPGPSGCRDGVGTGVERVITAEQSQFSSPRGPALFMSKTKPLQGLEVSPLMGHPKQLSIAVLKLIKSVSGQWSGCIMKTNWNRGGGGVVSEPFELLEKAKTCSLAFH